MIIDKKKLKKLFESKNQSRKRNAKTSKGKRINRSLNNRPSKNLRTGSISRKHKTAKHQKGGLGYNKPPYIQDSLTELNFTELQKRFIGPSKKLELAEYIAPRTVQESSDSVNGYPFFKKTDFQKVRNPGGGDCLYYSMITALQDIFTTDPLQFMTCIASDYQGSLSITGDSSEKAVTCDTSQYRIRELLSSYIKTDAGRNVLFNIPGFRQILISMGFHDHSTRTQQSGEALPNDNAEFRFNVDSAQALQIAADDNIEVDNYDAVPFVAAVQRGNRRATSLSMAWKQPDLKVIADTIADNILYNGGIFGKTIVEVGTYDWGRIKGVPTNSSPEWGGAEHMDMFANMLNCRIALLCPLRSINVSSSDTASKQYSTLERNMVTQAQLFTPSSAITDASIDQLPIIYLYYSTPALMTRGDENDTPSSHYEYLRVSNNSSNKEYLSNDPEYSALATLGDIVRYDVQARVDQTGLTESVKKTIDSLMTNAKSSSEKSIISKLGGKPGIESLVRSDHDLQSNIDNWWSKVSFGKEGEITSFLSNLVSAKSLQDALPEKMQKYGSEMTLFHRLLTGHPDLKDVRDKDYLKVMETLSASKKQTLDDTFVIDNIGELTDQLKAYLDKSSTVSGKPKLGDRLKNLREKITKTGADKESEGAKPPPVSGNLRKAVGLLKDKILAKNGPPPPPPGKKDAAAASGKKDAAKASDGKDKKGPPPAVPGKKGAPPTASDDETDSAAAPDKEGPPPAVPGKKGALPTASDDGKDTTAVPDKEGPPPAVPGKKGALPTASDDGKDTTAVPDKKILRQQFQAKKVLHRQLLMMERMKKILRQQFQAKKVLHQQLLMMERTPQRLQIKRVLRQQLLVKRMGLQVKKKHQILIKRSHLMIQVRKLEILHQVSLQAVKKTIPI